MPQNQAMTRSIEILGRKVWVEITPAAQAALADRNTPLHAEMELYFSCLIRKRVRFDVPQRGPVALVGQELSIGFRPVMARGCAIADYTPEALEDLPITEPARFVPHWLRIDCRDGAWRGEFGY